MQNASLWDYANGQVRSDWLFREIDNIFKSIEAGIEEQCWILLLTLRASKW